MVTYHNTKTKESLEIVIKKGSFKHTLCFKRDILIHCNIRDEIDKVKLDIKSLGFGNLITLKIINHVVGSIHDYFKYINNEN